MAITKGLKGRL